MVTSSGWLSASNGKRLTGGYNREVRSAFIPSKILCVTAILLCAAACNHSIENKEAVRQGVIDHLVAVGMPGMNVEVTSVQFNGKQADVTVSITAKGMDPSQGMSMPYRLEQQGGKWIVQPRENSGQSPHGGGVMPGVANPHGAGTEEPGGGSAAKMPSPADLPPAGKSK